MIMEIEIRARIKNLPDFVGRIGSLSGIRSVKTGERQTDTYIRHAGDKERVMIIRIRRLEEGAVLTFKARAGEKDTAWHDVDIPLPDPDRLEDILMSSGYVYVVLIDKLRDAFRYRDFEINIDQIRELGGFVEIAYETEEPVPADRRARLLVEMKDILYNLGCDEASIVEMGYVPLMEEAMKNVER